VVQKLQKNHAGGGGEPRKRLFSSPFSLNTRHPLGERLLGGRIFLLPVVYRAVAATMPPVVGLAQDLNRSRRRQLMVAAATADQNLCCSHRTRESN
jgi:hypothetical protein